MKGGGGNSAEGRSRGITHSFRTVGALNTTAVEEEANGARSLALSLAESIHQFLESSGPLDLEEDLVVVVGDFDIEMIAGCTALWLLWDTRTSVLVRSRHFEGDTREGVSLDVWFVRMARWRSLAWIARIEVSRQDGY